MSIEDLSIILNRFPETERMPALFVGHGSPMNAIEDNSYTAAWEALGKELPKPKAILCISAHWYTRGTFVHTLGHPETIYDFYGFPTELYEKAYPCPGAPKYADAVSKVVTKTEVIPETGWGIDHGAWVPLSRMYPLADIPVFQLSIDMTRDARLHYELGRELRSFRDRGVLILGSGNIVHNLGDINWDPDASPFDWASEFDAYVADHLVRGEHDPIIGYDSYGTSAARLAVPTPDHFLPLLYVIGSQYEGEPVSFPVQGIALGSIGMRCVRIG